MRQKHLGAILLALLAIARAEVVSTQSSTLQASHQESATARAWDWQHEENSARGWPAAKQLDKAATATRASFDFCGQQGYPDRVVIASAANNSLQFLTDLGFKYVAYQFQDPAKPYYYANVANEAGLYLQYIIDHFDCLPNAMAFIHGHGAGSWHAQSMHYILPNLRWDTLTGFHDINRKMTPWKIKIASLPGDPPDHSVVATGASVFNGSFDTKQIHKGKAYDSWYIGVWQQQTEMSRAWDKFFGRYFGAAPEEIQYVCCAQFFVSKDRVLQRGRSFFDELKQYMMSNDLRPTAIHDRKYINGDVLSLYWALIFMEGWYYEPWPECDVFYCDAEHGYEGEPIQSSRQLPGNASAEAVRLQTGSHQHRRRAGSHHRRF